ncbi:hypothetical protein MRX96_020826 [Rhipicephalus microplus]
MDTKRFLEEIRLWDIIGSMFGVTGTQAMLKFKNIRARWMKLVSGVEVNTRSGAPGNHGKIKWPLFAIIDSMLRKTPHYAENYAIANEGEESCCYASPEICLEEECPEGHTGKPTHFTPSRKRKTCIEEVDASIKDLLGSFSTSIEAIAKKKEALQPDECDIAGSLVAVKLKALPKRKRSQGLFEIHKLLHEAEMECLEDSN